MLAHGVVSCGDKSVVFPCHLFNHCLSLLHSMPQLTGQQSTGPSLSIRWLHLLEIGVDIKSTHTSPHCSSFTVLVGWNRGCLSQCFDLNIGVTIVQRFDVKSEDATRWRCVVGIDAWTSCAESNSCHFRILVICPGFFGREPSVMSAVVLWKDLTLFWKAPHVLHSELCGLWSPDHADCAVVCSH